MGGGRDSLGGGVGLEASCVALGKCFDLSEMSSSEAESEITACRVEA